MTFEVVGGSWTLCSRPISGPFLIWKKKNIFKGASHFQMFGIISAIWSRGVIKICLQAYMWNLSNMKKKKRIFEYILGTLLEYICLLSQPFDVPTSFIFTQYAFSPITFVQIMLQGLKDNMWVHSLTGSAHYNLQCYVYIWIIRIW